MREYIYNTHKPYRQLLRFCLVMLFFLSVMLLFQLHMETHFRIYNNTLRFHVRAASDEKLEQELKLQVRDAVLEALKRKISQPRTASLMETILKENREDIGKEAENCLKEYGYERKVTVYFTKERFPIRRYGAIIFPAGTYHAMRIDVGAGKGHNWWCALYPELCYNKEEFVLSKEGQRQIKTALSQLEQKLLTGRAASLGGRAAEFIMERKKNGK